MLPTVRVSVVCRVSADSGIDGAHVSVYCDVEDDEEDEEEDQEEDQDAG